MCGVLDALRNLFSCLFKGFCRLKHFPRAVQTYVFLLVKATTCVGDPDVVSLP